METKDNLNTKNVSFNEIVTNLKIITDTFPRIKTNILFTDILYYFGSVFEHPEIKDLPKDNNLKFLNIITESLYNTIEFFPNIQQDQIDGLYHYIDLLVTLIIKNIYVLDCKNASLEHDKLKHLCDVLETSNEKSYIFQRITLISQPHTSLICSSLYLSFVMNWVYHYKSAIIQPNTQTSNPKSYTYLLSDIAQIQKILRNSISEIKNLPISEIASIIYLSNNLDTIIYFLNLPTKIVRNLLNESIQIQNLIFGTKLDLDDETLKRIIKYKEEFPSIDVCFSKVLGLADNIKNKKSTYHNLFPLLRDCLNLISTIDMPSIYKKNENFDAHYLLSHLIMRNIILHLEDHRVFILDFQNFISKFERFRLQNRSLNLSLELTSDSINSDKTATFHFKSPRNLFVSFINENKVDESKLFNDFHQMILSNPALDLNHPTVFNIYSSDSKEVLYAFYNFSFSHSSEVRFSLTFDLDKNHKNTVNFIITYINFYLMHEAFNGSRFDYFDRFYFTLSAYEIIKKISKLCILTDSTKEPIFNAQMSEFIFKSLTYLTNCSNLILPERKPFIKVDLEKIMDSLSPINIIPFSENLSQIGNITPSILSDNILSIFNHIFITHHELINKNEIYIPRSLPSKQIDFLKNLLLHVFEIIIPSFLKNSSMLQTVALYQEYYNIASFCTKILKHPSFNETSFSFEIGSLVQKLTKIAISYLDNALIKNNDDFKKEQKPLHSVKISNTAFSDTVLIFQEIYLFIEQYKTKDKTACELKIIEITNKLKKDFSITTTVNNKWYKIDQTTLSEINICLDELTKILKSSLSHKTSKPLLELFKRISQHIYLNSLKTDIPDFSSDESSLENIRKKSKKKKTNKKRIKKNLNTLNKIQNIKPDQDIISDVSEALLKEDIDSDSSSKDEEITCLALPPEDNNNILNDILTNDNLQELPRPVSPILFSNPVVSLSPTNQCLSPNPEDITTQVTLPYSEPFNPVELESNADIEVSIDTQLSPLTDNDRKTYIDKALQDYNIALVMMNQRPFIDIETREHFINAISNLEELDIDDYENIRLICYFNCTISFINHFRFYQDQDKIKDLEKAANRASGFLFETTTLYLQINDAVPYSLAFLPSVASLLGMLRDIETQFNNLSAESEEVYIGLKHLIAVNFNLALITEKLGMTKISFDLFNRALSLAVLTNDQPKLNHITQFIQGKQAYSLYQIQQQSMNLSWCNQALSFIYDSKADIGAKDIGNSPEQLNILRTTPYMNPR